MRSHFAFRGFVLLFAVSALVSTGVARAGSVQSSCVAQIDANGNKIPCDAGPTTPTGPSAGDGGGPTPTQQLQLQGAHDAGAAIGKGISDILFGAPDKPAPDPNVEQQQALRQQQNRMQQQLRWQQQQDQNKQGQEGAERAQAQEDAKELLGELHGGDDDLHETFRANEATFHDRVAWDEHLRAGVERQHALKNKKNEDWCKLHLPLFAAPDGEKERWDGRCSATELQLH